MQPFKRAKELRGAVSMTTWEAGLLQARAYRNLEQTLQQTLKPFGITHSEWALLGSFTTTPEMNITQISRLLGVTKPMATTMVARLEKKGLLERSNHEHDSRVVLIQLTGQAKKLVPKVEETCRAAMRGVIHDVSVKDLLAYIRVLEQITKNRP